jgi:colanic acid/amylovoran biosynthesis glycosyltransferase
MGSGEDKLVVHVRRRFWIQPETFILGYINALRAWRPVVLTNSHENCEIVSHLDVRTFPTVLDLRKMSLFDPLWLRKQFYRFALGLDGELLAYPRLKALMPAVVHAHFGTEGFEVASSANRLGIPLVTSFYGVDLFRTAKLEAWLPRFEYLFGHGDRFLVEGPSMKRELIAAGCPEKKIAIQRIAVDLSRYTFRERRREISRPVKILMCGRFMEKKGFGYALQALSRVVDDTSFEIRVIGDGPEKEALERIVGSSPPALARSLSWLGMRPHEEVIAHLDWADAVLHPSVTASDGDSEGGAPTILIEAQACGVPVIATKHADIPYVTVPGKSALLARERDVDGLVACLREFVDGPQRWSEMGRAGRRHMEAQHDIAREARRLEAVYDVLAEGR